MESWKISMNLQMEGTLKRIQVSTLYINATLGGYYTLSGITKVYHTKLIPWNKPFRLA